MTKMTYVNALEIAIATVENEEVKMASGIVKKNSLSNNNNVFYAVKKDSKYNIYNL